MRFVKDNVLAGAEIRRKFPILLAADTVKGAAMIMGPTPGTDNDCMILATGACDDFIGLMNEDYDYSEEGTSVCGSSYVYKEVIMNPFAMIEAEYDQTDTMAATNAAATTALTLTSLEDNIDGAFLYVVSGDAIGQVRSLTASAAGSCTLKTAFSPALAVADTLIKIVPNNHGLVKLNSAATKIGTDVGAGSGVVRVGYNVIKTVSAAAAILQPGVHSGMGSLDDRKVKFYCVFQFTDSIYNPA